MRTAALRVGTALVGLWVVAGCASGSPSVPLSGTTTAAPAPSAAAPTTTPAVPVTNPPTSVDMANQPPQTADGMSLVFWPNIAVGLTYASCRPQVIFQPDQVVPGPTGPYSVNDTTKVGGTCDMTFDVDASLPWRAYTREIATGAWTLVLGNGSQAAGERLTVTVQDRVSEAVLLVQARGYPLGQPVGQAGDHGAIVNRLPASVNSFFTR